MNNLSSQNEYKITVFQDVRVCRKVDGVHTCDLQIFQTSRSHFQILGTKGW